ncbi:MAG: hypothetical protein QM477_09430 [Planctomycetota bacterium]
MSHLTSSSNQSTTNGWAKVVLANGEPLFFHFERSGTTVKVSKHGLLGRRLFKGDASATLFVGESLWAVYQNRVALPFEMSLESQRGFIAAALCSDSADSFAEKVVKTRFASREKDLCHV